MMRGGAIAGAYGDFSAPISARGYGRMAAGRGRRYWSTDKSTHRRRTRRLLTLRACAAHERRCRGYRCCWRFQTYSQDFSIADAWRLPALQPAATFLTTISRFVALLAAGRLGNMMPTLLSGVADAQAPTTAPLVSGAHYQRAADATAACRRIMTLSGLADWGGSLPFITRISMAMGIGAGAACSAHGFRAPTRLPDSFRDFESRRRGRRYEGAERKRRACRPQAIGGCRG